jgi:ATP-binding cassette subfamily F protein uup
VAHLLGAEGVHVEYAAGPIFASLTLGIDAGDRIGIVGGNGAGKSTLLRLLAGRQGPDAGRVSVRGGTTVGLLAQADDLDPARSAGQVIVGDAATHTWAADTRVREIVDGLLTGIGWEAPVASLGGGQRRRVSLAATLVGDHDVLFLDEPTNHLDLEGISWLAEHLKRRWAPAAGALAVVTHDRWFLDEVCTTTWEVHDGTVDAYEGGYAAYVLLRVERERLAAAAEAKRQNLLRKELAWLRRGPPARTSKPKFRIETANALIADEPPVRDPIALQRLAVARLGRDVIDLDDVSVMLGGVPVLEHVDWQIGPGERVGVLGANGAGKTTLLNVVAGALAPTFGAVRRGSTVKVARLGQDASAIEGEGAALVRDLLRQRRATYRTGGRDLTPAQLLERLGFSSTHLSTPVARLSGGQKRRLQLLLALLDEPNVLVLDEPTNDLDTDMLAVVEDLLDSWPGTLLVVSHDRYFVERVTDQVYAVIGRRLLHLPGGVEAYLRLAGRGGEGLGASAVHGGQPRPDPRARRRQERAGQRAAQQAAARQLATIERELGGVPDEIAELNRTIAAHDQRDYRGLAELVVALEALTAKQAELETRWLELSEAIERPPSEQASESARLAGPPPGVAGLS